MNKNKFNQWTSKRENLVELRSEIMQIARRYLEKFTVTNDLKEINFNAGRKLACVIADRQADRKTDGWMYILN